MPQKKPTASTPKPRGRPRQTPKPVDDPRVVELVGLLEVSGMDHGDAARLINKRLGFPWKKGLTAQDVEVMFLRIRADAAMRFLRDEKIAGDRNRRDVARLDAISSALFFRSVGIDPVNDTRFPPEPAAAREFREVTKLTRTILGLDEDAGAGDLGGLQGKRGKPAGLGGGRRVVFEVMTEAEVAGIRERIASEDDDVVAACGEEVQGQLAPMHEGPMPTALPAAENDKAAFATAVRKVVPG